MMPEPELRPAPVETLPKPGGVYGHRETRWAEISVKGNGGDYSIADLAGCGDELHVAPLNVDLGWYLGASGRSGDV